MNPRGLLDIFLPYQRVFFTNEKKRKLWVSSRQIGKSFTVSGLLVYKALSKPNGLSLCISTGQRAASEIIRKCAQFAEAIKRLSAGKLDYSASFDSIKFSNGCRVLSLPSSTDGSNLRGWSANCVAVDEAAYVWHLEEIMQAINPTLSRDPDAELILTTTPAGKSGPFYSLYARALSDDAWHVQTTTIEDAIRDGLKTDLQSLRTLCPDPQAFAQEYMCEFSDSTNALLDTSLLQETQGDPKLIDFFMGVDFGRKHDATAISIIGRTGDGKLHLVDVTRLSNTEYVKQFSIIQAKWKQWHPKLAYCDAGGLGGPLAEELNRQVSAMIKGIQFTQQSKSDMFEYLRKVVFDRQLFIKPDFLADLCREVQMVRQAITDSGKTTYEAARVPGSHADIVSSLILALHASRQSRPQLAAPSFCTPFSCF